MKDPREKMKTIKCADCPKSVSSSMGRKKLCHGCSKKRAFLRGSLRRERVGGTRKEKNGIHFDWLNFQD